MATLCRNTALEAPGPVTCAAQPGTTFVIEDLYYNLEQRRKVGQLRLAQPVLTARRNYSTSHDYIPTKLLQALGSAAEEYSRIVDLVGKYAVSRPDVAFSCRKQVGQATCCLACTLSFCGP